MPDTAEVFDTPYEQEGYCMAAPNGKIRADLNQRDSAYRATGVAGSGDKARKYSRELRLES